MEKKRRHILPMERREDISGQWKIREDMFGK
jgi:hypothetical protein